MLPGPLFGWSDAYPHQFLIRGKSFRVRSNGEANEAGAIRLSEFQFYVRERFFYDYRFDLQTPVWRHEIRVEKVAPVRQEWQYPRATVQVVGAAFNREGADCALRCDWMA
jgi:hypothetical protein